MKKTVAIFVAVLAAILLLPSMASALTYLPSPSSPITNVGDNVTASVSADFNNDGADDIASAATGTGQGLYIQLSNVDGTFTQTAGSPLFSANSALTLRSADLNTDGNADLLAFNQRYSSIYVYLGDGSGGFTAHGEINGNQGIMDMNAHAVGNLNGDTIPDVVIGYYGSQFSVSYGDGNGGFTTAPSQVMPGTPGQGLDGMYRMAVGDFDNNGDNDIALGLQPCVAEPPGPPDASSPYCANPQPTMNAIFIAEGDGSGNFTFPNTGNTHMLSGGAPARITSMRTGNFNSDGIEDLAVSAGNQTIQTFLGNDSNFLVVNPDPKGVVQTGPEPTSVQTADLDLDGRQDLVWANRSGINFELALQTGASGFKVPANSPFPAAGSDPNPFDLSIGDFNNDGAVDLTGAGLTPAPGVVAMLNSPAIEADPVAFGNQQVGIVSGARTLSLRSSGAVPAVIDAITLSGTSPADFSSTDLTSCVGARAAGSSCNLHLSFTPTGIGPRSATVLVSFAGSPAPVEIPVTGVGTQPPAPPKTISASLALQAPQKVRRGKSLKVAATITNTGETALSNVVLKTTVTKKLAGTPKPITVSSLAAGKSIRKVITVKVRKKAKPGKKLKGKVTARTVDGAVASSATFSVKITK